MSDIAERIVKIVVDQMGVYPEQVTPDSSFQEDLDGDSLDVVALVLAIEDEFEITIPDNDVQQIKTVQDAIRYVESARS